METQTCPVPHISTIRRYVPAEKHNVTNFAERQERRRREIQRLDAGYVAELGGGVITRVVAKDGYTGQAIHVTASGGLAEIMGWVRAMRGRGWHVTYTNDRSKATSVATRKDSIAPASAGKENQS